MFCPNCGTEYPQGITVCPVCNLALVAEPPPARAEHAGDDFVAVLTTEDAGELAVARGLLEAEGIPCTEGGEQIGQAAFGSNPIAGPTQLLVPREREAEARELLAAGEDVRLSEDEA